MQDKEIFPLSYRDYWELFNRTLVVAGYPKTIRPYAVRLGAGARLDGTLTIPKIPLHSAANIHFQVY